MLSVWTTMLNLVQEPKNIALPRMLDLLIIDVSQDIQLKGVFLVLEGIGSENLEGKMSLGS